MGNLLHPKRRGPWTGLPLTKHGPTLVEQDSLWEAPGVSRSSRGAVILLQADAE